MIKQKTPRDKKYLKFVKKYPCCACGWRPNNHLLVHAHHTETGGMGIKGSDYSAVPLCFICHDKVHKTGGKNNIPNLEQVIERLQAHYKQWLKELKNVGVTETANF